MKLYVFVVLVLFAYSEGKINVPLLVTYTTWVGDEGPTQIIRSSILVARKNETLYDVMQRAARNDPKSFAFEDQSFEGLGHYITSIGGVKEDKETDHYWMIYKLKHLPNPFKPPSDDELSPVGVDGILVENFDNYLWWYKRVDLNNHK